MSRPSISFGFCAALTGGIACGKSTVADWFARKNVEILDADAVSHRLTAPGGAAMPAIREAFGAGYWDAAGGLDRAKMGALVFAEEAERRKLEAILHPLIQAEVRAWAEGIRQSERRGLAVIPLLFECGVEVDSWNAVFCVAADDAAIRQRLLDRGLSEEEAQQRLQAQWPLEEKIRRATETIWNNGTREELAARCEVIWKSYFEERNLS